MKLDNSFDKFFKIISFIFEEYFNPSIIQVERKDLTKVGFAFINFIGFRKQCFIKELVERFSISPSTASEHIERLYNTNYIYKHPHRTDKRKVMISLTEKGLELFQQFNKRKYHLLRERFLKLNEKNAKNLIELLSKFI